MLVDSERLVGNKLDQQSATPKPPRPQNKREPYETIVILHFGADVYCELWRALL